MSNKQPVRLLILDESQNRAEELIVLLRNAGRATRAHQVESTEELTRLLQDQPWDMFLAREKANDICAEECLQIIKSLEKDVPFILLADTRDPTAITAGMKAGALDVVLNDDDERLVLIMERELLNLNHRRARRKAMVDLRETERRNQLLLDSSSAAIAYVHEGMHVYTNRAYGELFGYDDLDDFVGIPIIDLISSEDQSKFKTLLKAATGSGDVADEITCVAMDSSRILTNLTATPASYDNEECTQVIFRAMTDDSDLENRLKEISSQDLLTGLYNRQYFAENLDSAVDLAASGQQSFVFFYIAIDHFPKVRSEAGISNADLVLGDVASVIRHQVDDSHLLARFGDDVFTLLYKGGDPEEASAVAESIRAAVDDHLSEISGKSYHLTVSIGLALITENSPSGEEIISRGHRATDALKDGNGVNLHQQETSQSGEEDGLSSSNIQLLIKDAIARNSLKLLFQPIISLHGDDDEQFEVLLRLIDNDGNELLPGKFLTPAEEAGLLPKLDRWVILQSIKMLSVQRSEGGKARLFINITYKSVIDDTFLPWVSVALKAARLPSDAIIFQVHESDATSYIKQASVFAKGIAQLHCKTSINHFGCSLNPFNLLKHLSPDYVKLDGSFAQQIEDDKAKRAELIDMVKSLQQKGVLTAISGVESPIALSTLWEAGVNFIQGYYISPPLETLEYDFGSEGE